MVVIGLDISTKTGFAVIKDGKLVDFGLLQTKAVSEDMAEDFLLLKRANLAMNEITSKINLYKPDRIIIEQTNAGKFRASQKQLEFIHCQVLSSILSMGMEKITYYVDTSKWRSVLNIRLSKEQKHHNKKVKLGMSKGKITPKHLAVAWANNCFSLSLLKKDHDIADAIALAQYGFKMKNEAAGLDLNLVFKSLKGK